jgi:BMFP domain-containing protein YqiC
MPRNDNRFFDDLAKAATGAVGALSGLRKQIHAEIKSQVGRFMVEMDFVSRDEFDIVEAVSREARLQNQRLEARVIELEKKLGLKAKTPAKTTTKAKPKAKAKKK